MSERGGWSNYTALKRAMVSCFFWIFMCWGPPVKPSMKSSERFTTRVPRATGVSSPRSPDRLCCGSVVHVGGGEGWSGLSTKPTPQGAVTRPVDRVCILERGAARPPPEGIVSRLCGRRTLHIPCFIIF